MSHIQEIENEIDRIMKKVDDIYHEGYDELSVFLKSKDNILFTDYPYPETAYEIDPDKLKDFLRSSHLNYLQGKRKELEGELKQEGQPAKNYKEDVFNITNIGYNLAKQEEIDKIDKEIKENGNLY